MRIEVSKQGNPKRFIHLFSKDGVFVTNAAYVPHENEPVPDVIHYDSTLYHHFRSGETPNEEHYRESQMLMLNKPEGNSPIPVALNTESLRTGYKLMRFEPIGEVGALHFGIKQADEDTIIFGVSSSLEDMERHFVPEVLYTIRSIPDTQILEIYKRNPEEYTEV